MKIHYKSLLMSGVLTIAVLVGCSAPGGSSAQASVSNSSVSSESVNSESVNDNSASEEASNSETANSESVSENPYGDLPVLGTWVMTESSIDNEMINGMLGETKKEFKTDGTCVVTEGGEEGTQYYMWTDEYYVAMEGDIAIVWTYEFTDEDTLVTTLYSETYSGKYDKDTYLASLPGESTMDGDVASFTWTRQK